MPLLLGYILSLIYIFAAIIPLIMYDFHSNNKRYFEMTNWVTVNFVIPFIGINDYSGLKVCEIGCGEGGVLKGFLDHGAKGIGIELFDSRAQIARSFLHEEIQKGSAKIITKNVYDVDPKNDPDLKFDFIVLKDVIEHIPEQHIFIKKLHDLLAPGGKVFFGYPPWWMPFGGHQQICKNNFLKKLPWMHLLPRPLYKFILASFGEGEDTIKELFELKDTGITIEKMHRIIGDAGFKVISEKHWITNPIYVKKFNINPIVSKLNIPYLRNFYCTAHYVLFESKA
jgi:SAM-dependent methyltransferase